MAHPGVRPQRLFCRCGIPNGSPPLSYEMHAWLEHTGSAKLNQTVTADPEPPSDLGGGQPLASGCHGRQRDHCQTQRSAVVGSDLALCRRGEVARLEGRPATRCRLRIAALGKMASKPDALPHALGCSGRQAIAVRGVRTVEHLSTLVQRSSDPFVTNHTPIQRCCAALTPSTSMQVRIFRGYMQQICLLRRLPALHCLSRFLAGR
jgi:hypothetical protein